MKFTRYNYRRLADSLFRRGIHLVAMQYPTLDVEIVKEMLGCDERITYIDNKEAFANAIREHGYDAVFWDFFGGTFGHATALGDGILARNAARTVIEILPAVRR